MDGPGPKAAFVVRGGSFNDLRGTAVTRLALVGCSEAEIASITGHGLRAMCGRSSRNPLVAPI